MFANSPGQGEVRRNTTQIVSLSLWFPAPTIQGRSDCLDLRGRTSQDPPVCSCPSLPIS